jgi:hypothetical protein
MSFDAIKWALDRADVRNTQEVAVLVAIAQRANANGLCWPGISDIARRSRVCERSVYRILSALERRGLLRRRRRRHQSSEIWLNRELPHSSQLKGDSGVIQNPQVESPRTQASKISTERGRKRGKPRHRQSTKDGRRIWLDRGTTDYEAYAKDFAEAHGQPPAMCWNGSGAWFNLVGEVRP